MPRNRLQQNLSLVGLIGALAFAAEPGAIAQGSPEIRWQGAHAGAVNAVALSPDGSLVASSSVADRTTRIWRASDGALLRTLTHCAGIGCRGPSSIAFSPDGQQLAGAGSVLKIWRVADGSTALTVNAQFASIGYSPDGQTLAATGGTGYDNVFVRVLRVADGTTLASFLGGGAGVQFSPDGAYVAAVGRRGFDLWRSDGPLRWHLDGTRRALAFVPGTDQIAIAGNGLGDYRYDDTVGFFSVSNGALLNTLVRTGGIAALAFGGDAASLVSSGWDPNESFTSGFTPATGVLRFWNLSSKPAIVRSRALYDGDTGQTVPALAISPQLGVFAYAHDSAVVVAGLPDIQTCAPSLKPESVIIDRGGGNGSFVVDAPLSCTWEASSRVPWITITSANAGAGSGTVTFSVDESGAKTEKAAFDSIVGQIAVAGQSFLVDFGGEGDGCYWTPQPSSVTVGAAGGASSVTVFSATGCSWRATTREPWIHVPADAHVENGLVSFTVDPTASARTGTLLVGGTAVTIRQSGETKKK